MWVVYVCEFVCVNIYIYIMYIYVYTITREKVTTMTMCFFSSFVLIIHRVCVRGPRVPLNIPLLSCRTESRKEGSSKFYLSFSRFPLQPKIKNEGQEEKSAFIQSCAREE